MVSLGTWTYIFQGLLVALLFMLKKRIYFPYLLSFVVGFFFGIAVDLHQAWIEILPQGLAWRILYFCLSYLLICLGIALANRCKMGTGAHLCGPEKAMQRSDLSPGFSGGKAGAKDTQLVSPRCGNPHPRRET